MVFNIIALLDLSSLLVKVGPLLSSVDNILYSTYLIHIRTSCTFFSESKIQPSILPSDYNSREWIAFKNSPLYHLMDWSSTLHSQHGQPQPTTIGTQKLLLLQSTSSSRRTQMSPPLSNTPIPLDGQYVENSNGPVLLSQIYISILFLPLIPELWSLGL